MPLSRITPLVTLLVAALLSPAAAQTDDAAARRARMLEFGAKPRKGGGAEPRETNVGEALTAEEQARHVLSRLAFGPRPGQVGEVANTGWRAWAEAQLRPRGVDSATVDSAVAERYPSLRMTMSDAFRVYRPPYAGPEPTPEELERNNQLNEQIRRELVESVLYRATFSERQFEEVILEFWRNHFNIDQNKDDVAFLAPHYEEEVLRRFAFGRFEDLLLATARHPAMLIYLDNIVSQRPLTEREEALVARYEGRGRVPRSILARQRQRGLNENYARELMELHTLGVDNGYTQRDVTEVARVLTGWTAGWDDGGNYDFRFDANVHDDGEKRVLGRRLPERGGEAQGVELVRSLANHPKTAEFIAWKLCRYLVRDDPSEDLVQRVAKVFKQTDGDLPKVYEAIVMSDDFAFRQNASAKFKTPFEYVVSSLRATGAEVSDWSAVREALRRMGQPTYGCEDPTGYFDVAERWLDPGVLVYRWTYALSLTNGSLEGVRVPEATTRPLSLKSSDELAPAIAAMLALPAMEEERRKALFDAIAGAGSVEQALSLAVGSPAFQQQ